MIYSMPLPVPTWASVCSVTVAGSQKCQPTNNSRSRERVAKARVAGAKPASRESSRQVCSWHIRRVTCCETDNLISSRTFGQRASSSAWNYNGNTITHNWCNHRLPLKQYLSQSVSSKVRLSDNCHLFNFLKHYLVFTGLTQRTKIAILESISLRTSVTNRSSFMIRVTTFSSQCKIPRHIPDFLRQSYPCCTYLSNPKLCFHLLHLLYSHYCKCSLYKHIQNDVVSWLSAFLVFTLQVFKALNWLKKGKVTVTAFLLARLYCQYITTHSLCQSMFSSSHLENFRSAICWKMVHLSRLPHVTQCKTLSGKPCISLNTVFWDNALTMMTSLHLSHSLLKTVFSTVAILNVTTLTVTS